MSQLQQLALLTQDALQSLQETLGEAAAPQTKRRGPKKGRPRNKGAWRDLPPDCTQPYDLHGREGQAERPAAFTADDRRQMHAREEFARAIGREARRKQSAVERCNFFCNRLVESRFPSAHFSEMNLIPSGCALYGGHRIEREDEDE